MPISSESSLRSRSTPRSPRLDPFEPGRRAAPVEHGRRGVLLAREQRRANERAERARCELEVQSNVTLALNFSTLLAGMQRIAPRNATFAWPLPLNASGVIASTVAHLYGALTQTRTYVLDVPDAFALGARGRASRAPGANASTGFDTGDRNAQNVPRAPVRVACDEPVAARPGTQPVPGLLSGPHAAKHLGESEPAQESPPFDAQAIADRTVALWIEEGCDAVVALARAADGMQWVPEQRTLSQIMNRPCQMVFDQDAEPTTVRSLEASGEMGFSIELATIRRVQPVAAADQGPGPVSGSQAPSDGSGVREPSDAAPLTDWPHVRDAHKKLGPRCVCKPESSTSVFGRLAKALGEFLQGPCGAVVRHVYHRHALNELPRAAKVGSVVCDLIYQASPYGMGAALFGYLLEMTGKVVRSEPMSTQEMIQGINMLTFRPNAIHEVQVGRQRMLWTRNGLSKIRETPDGARLVHEARSASTPVERVPDLPVEHTAQGWKISEIPQEYRVSDGEAALVDDPAVIRRTAKTSGYVAVDGSVFEARTDGRSTRWYIVPPNGMHGTHIALEFNPGERRWEAIKLIGAGDPPPLAQRYEARDAELRTGGEQDVYLDAHAEAYDPDLLPGGADQLEIAQLVEHFVGDIPRSTRALGVLHQYIEARRWAQLNASLGGVVRSLFERGPTAQVDYFHGLLRGDVTSIPGFRRDMTPAELMGLAIEGGLNPYEAGTCAMEIADRRVRAEIFEAADRILRGGQRATAGALRSAHILVPGLAESASFEDMVSHFIYGELTATQRGALQPRIAEIAQRMYARWETLIRHVEHIRESAVPERSTEFLYGHERYQSIPIEGVGAETSLDRLFDLVDEYVSAGDATLVGALAHRIEEHQTELNVLCDEYLAASERLHFEHEAFIEGFNEASHIELPQTPHGSALELAAVFFNEALTMRERGAVYARFRQFDALDRIDAVVAEQRERGFGPEIRAGYDSATEARRAGAQSVSGEHDSAGSEGDMDVEASRESAGGETRPQPSPDHDAPIAPHYEFASGGQQAKRIVEICEALELETRTPFEIGQLSREADEIARYGNQARVDARRHRIVTGPEFGEYIDAYLNPEAHDFGDASASDSHEALLDMFRRDGTGARMRGRIAARIRALEVSQSVLDLNVLRSIYHNADTTGVMVLPQSQIPSMLNGLLDGPCFPLAAAMAVAMQQGEAAVIRLANRVARVVPSPDSMLPGTRLTITRESRDVLGGLASLAVRQPRAPGALAAGEIIPMQQSVDWSEVFEVLADSRHDLLMDVESLRGSASRQGQPVMTIDEMVAKTASTYLIETSRHAMLVRVEYQPRNVHGVAFRVYEPNYGVLTFDSFRAVKTALTHAFRSTFYVEHVLDHSPLVDIFAIDPERLGELRIRGNLRVRDLVGEAPFIDQAAGAHEEVPSRPAQGGVDDEARQEAARQEAARQEEARQEEAIRQVLAGTELL